MPTLTAKPAAAPVLTVRDKFAAARAELNAGLIERDEEIDLALTAMVAGEHLLLVGAPGCAKSLLLDSLLRWVDGDGFQILLTKFTTPEEVVGPISLSALKADRYARVTTGRLPEAHLAFIDEIWKASSAILNTLLRLLNEGVFENDGRFVACPLRLCVAASNEWPSTENGKELSALLDRFLFRKTVHYVAGADGLDRLLFDDNLSPEFSTRVTPDELDAAKAEAKALPWSDDAKNGLLTILAELAREGVVPSDRRKRKAVGAARAAAWLDGADRVGLVHLDVLQYVLWDDPAEQPETCAKVVARVANPAKTKINGFLLEAREVVAKSDVHQIDQAATASAALKEIAKKLAAYADHPKGAQALAYVRGEVRRIGKITAEGMGI